MRKLWLLPLLTFACADPVEDLCDGSLCWDASDLDPKDAGHRDRGVPNDAGEEDSGSDAACTPGAFELCDLPDRCGARRDCEGVCTGGTETPSCTCATPVCRIDGQWQCPDPVDLGQTCTTTTACGGAIGCDGLCQGGLACNRPPSDCHEPLGICETTTATCSYRPKAAAAPCDDGQACTHSDACDGAGACAGTSILCVSDRCATRTCNGTAACTVQELGNPIYETNNAGWDYSPNPPGTLAYRILSTDRPTYLLAAPGIGDRLQSLATNEANTCDWCGCAAPCAFSYTGRSINIGSAAQDGMVELRRWVNPNPIQHRSAVNSPGAGWTPELSLGWVCPP